MGRTKYNVDKSVAKRTYDDIVFASILEMKYYRDVLRPNVESGSVIGYELQKEYELQPGFTRNGKNVLPIVYVADFYVEYADGHTEIIDTKGCPDNVAKMKKKMFWYRYPDLDYKWITFVKKWGGWIDYEKAKELRRRAKRAMKKKEEEISGKG